MREFVANLSLSFKVKLGLFLNWKLLPLEIQGLLVTCNTSEPTAEILSLKLFSRPLAAVIVVTTATIPITIPKVVNTPLDLYPLIASIAILRISILSWRELMDAFELLAKLQEIIARQKRRGSDIEVDHGEADDLLLEYINYKEITEAYNAIDKWYA